MKTIREWFDQLPDGIRDKAILNSTYLKMSNKEESLEDALLGGFVWDESPEGFHYWNNLYEAALSKAKPHNDEVKVNKIELASKIAHEILSSRLNAAGIIYEDDDIIVRDTETDGTKYNARFQEQFDIEYNKVLTIIEEVSI